jgi:putative ABC transport system substrate-binding protein
MLFTVTRRQLIAALEVAAWPLAAGAQLRQIVVFVNYLESDPAGQLRATTFQQELEKRGWVVGRNLWIDYRWGIGDAGWIRSALEQLLELAPDVLLANGDAATREAQPAARTIPVIFIGAADPVATKTSTERSSPISP